MTRPSGFIVGSTLRWPIFVLDPDTEQFKDANSTPTVVVYKNGTATGETVTVTKRSATTGIYDCVFDPAGDAAGDLYSFDERANVTGSGSTPARDYPWIWHAYCQPNRVTLAAAQGDYAPAKAGDAMTLTTPERQALAALVETYIINEGDATAVLQAIADRIAADWVAGDASPLAIVAAIKNDATIAQMIARIDATITSRLAAAGYTAPDNTTIASISGRLPAALVDGRMDSAVGAMAAAVLTAAAIQAGALNGKGDWLTTLGAAAPAGWLNAAAVATDARTAIANAVEAAILNEGDATALLAAIAAKVEEFVLNEGDSRAVIAAIAAAVNAVVVAGQIGTDLTATKANAATAATQSTTAATQATTAATQATTAATQATTAATQSTTAATQSTQANAKVPSGLAAVVTDLIQMIANTGTANAQFTAKALELGVTGGGGLVGPYSVTVLVQDQANTPLENAVVRLRINATADASLTPVNGTVAFAANSGTYELAVLCNGYISSVTPVVVNGANVSTTITLTTAGVTPSGDPATTTGFATLRHPNNQPEPGAVVKVKLSSVPTGSGNGFDTAEVSYTADNNGLVQVPGMLKGAAYVIKRGGKKNEQTVTVPANAGATWAIPNFAGAS